MVDNGTGAKQREACRRYMKANPTECTVMALSCYSYSTAGLVLLWLWRVLPSSYYPFDNPSGFFWLGVSLVAQGPVSYLGDVYSVLRLRSNQATFCNIDLFLASTNTLLGSVAIAGAFRSLTEPRYVVNCELPINLLLTSFVVRSFIDKHWQV